MKRNTVNRIGYLRYLSNSLIEQELRISGVHDLHTSHGSIIFNLLSKGPMSMKQLASEIHRDKSTLTVLIRKLLNSGYVHIDHSETDKRSKTVSLTNKGNEIRNIFFDVSSKLNTSLWSGISKDEAVTFEVVLNKMIDNLKEVVE